MATVRLLEIISALTTCCSPAEVKASRQESRRRQELSRHYTLASLTCAVLKIDLGTSWLLRMSTCGWSSTLPSSSSSASPAPSSPSSSPSTSPPRFDGHINQSINIYFRIFFTNMLLMTYTVNDPRADKGYLSVKMVKTVFFLSTLSTCRTFGNSTTPGKISQSCWLGQ